MKKTIIVFFMAIIFSISVFGQWSDIDMQVTRATINVILTQIDGRLPLPQGSVQTSPGGRRYRFAMDYHPHNQQLVIVVTRQ